MEEQKGIEFSEEQFPVSSNNLFSILQKEIPDLKVANYPIVKEDLSGSHSGHNIHDDQIESKPIPNGFFDILGLSKRNPTNRD